MKKIGSFCLRYRRGGIILLYMMIYSVLFALLESRQVYEYHVVHTPLDDMLPFCGAFIIPYMLWFPYILVTVLFILFAEKDKGEYYRLISNLMIGMSIFLMVSYVYPNMQELRPAVLSEASVFTPVVRWLYSTDTPTNVLPSIHVFNSLACHMAIAHSQVLERKCRFVKTLSLILCISIILSTMFLKQHSVIDVALGSAMALLGYIIFYPQEVRVGQLAYAQGGKSGQRR